ncbi:flagellar biosynthesis protein FlhF [Crenobacter sp. SG2305]|uniref:flagellar biosynthesis protein FlhF n=1 Tax=Crenobacter oryzisoli TaxID=3056844 RepID=UPI0025AACFA9|nr:flagellar biosynthesis protein FlhF [Crenobacter sp. SG2305]MDN0082593.1 flagellar biosynthesis protein FlhF [Crenobacter sp. SG2305]
MVVKKFFGNSTREALRLVRDELGEDALILSNRPGKDGGVEIMAIADVELSAVAKAVPNPVTSPRPQSATHSPVQRAIARTYALPVEPLEHSWNNRRHDEMASAVTMHSFAQLSTDAATKPQPLVEPSPSEALMAELPDEAPQVDASSAPTLKSPLTEVDHTWLDDGPPIPTSPPLHPDLSQVTATVSSEIRSVGDEVRQLRSLLQSQLAGFAWSDMREQAPERLELYRRLLSCGFSAALIRQLIDKLPEAYKSETALQWARSTLAHNLRCGDIEADLFEAGGVFALVGPTGVGKTTTVAKLAARATLKYGAQNVALITSDSYRIGAQDQLRIYGKILGVPVHAVQSGQDLSLALADLSERHVVLIDTMGMSQRDSRVIEQTDLLSAATKRPVNRILLLAANSDGHTLDDVVNHYRGNGLFGCILSKLDEAVPLGSCLDVVIRHRLQLLALANGQRVPEDLHAAQPAPLIERAFAPRQAPSPFELFTDELPMMHAAQAGLL